MKTIQQFGKKYLSSFLMLILLISLTYYYILKQCDLESLVATIKSSDYKYLLIGIGIVLLNIWLEGVSLHIIGQSLNVTIGLFRSFCYACVDLYYCGITPSATGGQPVLAYYMSRDQIPISKSTIIILLYTVVYKVVLLILGVGVLLVHRDFIMLNKLTFALFIIGVVVNIAIIAICLLCMYSRTTVKNIVVKAINLLSNLHLIKNKEKKIEGFYTHIEEYHRSAQYVKGNRKVLVRVIIVTLIQRIALFSVGYLVYRSFDLGQFGFFDILALQVVISMTVDSLPLPGAVGVSEGMFYLLYTKVYSEGMIAPAMVLTRGINFYFMLLLTGVITIVYHIATTKPSKVLKGE